MKNNVKVDPSLFKFADEFSSLYKKLITGAGVYKSDDRKYVIRYDHNWPAVCSFGHTSKQIVFGKKQIKGYSPNYVFYLILWATAIGKNKGKTMKADHIATAQYLTTGRSKIDLLIGFSKMCKRDPEANTLPLNIKRAEQLIKKLKSD